MLATAELECFVITLDAVALNVALPLIRDDLDAGMSGLQQVVDSHTLIFAGWPGANTGDGSPQRPPLRL